MYLNKLFPLITSILIFSACEPEPKAPAYDKQLLLGQWELTEAWRNNKKTETLIGTFYEFGESGSMRTNFTQDMQEGEFKYTFDGRDITQNGENEMIYHIDTLTNSKLIFSTTLSNFQFKLALSKKADSEEESNSGL